MSVSVSQPGPGTACCACRSWASTTWRSCLLICPMTPCTSARPLMPPWGPGGPNSPSSVRVCRRTHPLKVCEMSRVFLTRSSPAPVPPDNPVIDGGPEVLLNAGESYNLSCVSRGAKPPSVVEWLKDGLPVEGAASTTVRPHPHWTRSISTVFYLDQRSEQYLSAFHHQEVLADRKRVTTHSYLPIQPVDSDTGRNYSCVASNLAVPSGKSTTVTLNVHRKQWYWTEMEAGCNPRTFVAFAKTQDSLHLQYIVTLPC